MARARSPNRDKAFDIYKEYDGNITNKEIADMLNENEKTISNWKCRDKWNVVLQKNEYSTTKEKASKKTNKNTKKESVIEEVKEVLGNTELTDKQRLFCIYYIKCFNATKAYQKAYGCSYETSMVEGFRTLRNPKIKLEIEKLKQDKFNRVFLDEDDIFQRYIDIAFSDITDYIDFGNEEVDGEFGPYTRSYVNLKNSFEVDGALISEVSQGKDGIKLKLQDKMKALQWLSDRMDLLPTNTRLRLENEKSKLELDVMKMELEIMKQGLQDDEVEDDGFIGALEAQVGDAWDD